MKDLSNYNNPLLLLSGGKDSIATLVYLLDNNQTNFKVIYVDTGDTFKETIRVVESVALHLSTLITPIPLIKLVTNVSKDIELNGYPSDVVPIESFKSTNKEALKIQSFVKCCNTNITAPILHYAKAMGSNLLITGHRQNDFRNFGFVDGSNIDGMEIYNPIDLWNSANVASYLKSKNSYFPHFDMEHSSLDCRKCTAFLRDTKHVKELLRKDYQEDYIIVKERLQLIKNELLYNVNNIDDVLGGNNA